jgi:micrococcal nuclease
VIELASGESLNLSCVEACFAWWYRKYAPSDKELANAEAKARNAGRGLWGDPNPVPPWDWRSAKKSPSQEMTPLLSTPATGDYWLTTSSQKRHRKGCRYYKETEGRQCGPDEGDPCKACGG